MNEPRPRILNPRSCFCAILAGSCATAQASGSGVVQFVQVGPAGAAAPAPVSEAFSDAQISATLTPNGVSIAGTTATAWSLKLASTRTRAFGPACYERARHASAAVPSRPLLEFVHGSGTCEPIGGRYKVLEYQVDAGTGRLAKLAVDFHQYCGDLNHAVAGSLRYHSELPVDAQPLAPMFSASGSVYVLGNSEYVTQGDNYAFPIDAFNTSALLDASGSELMFDSAVNGWQLSFAAPSGQPLAAGTYAAAQKTGYQDPAHPGLDYDMASRSCTRVSGAFNIGAIAWDPVDHQPTDVFATFSQSCETTSPAIGGVIAYSAKFESGPFVDDVIQIEGFEPDRAWPLVWPCQ